MTNSGIFSTSDTVSEKKAEKRFKKFIRSLSFKPEKTKDVRELNYALEKIRLEMYEYQKKYDFIPDTAYSFIARCSKMHRKLMDDIEK